MRRLLGLAVATFTLAGWVIAGETPRAEIDFFFEPICVGHEVTFDGSPSSDPDTVGEGEPISVYAWRAIQTSGTGGIEQQHASSSPTWTTSFTAPGRYNITLTVTDNDGEVSEPFTMSIGALQISVSSTLVRLQPDETKEFTVTVLPADGVHDIFVDELFGIAERIEISSDEDLEGGIRRYEIVGLDEGREIFAVSANPFGGSVCHSISVIVGDTTLPEAVAATSTPLLPAGGTAHLDGSQSSDTDQVGDLPDIETYTWTLRNLSDPTLAPVVVESFLDSASVQLNVAGEYDVELVVKDLDHETSEPVSSDAHVTILVVGVTMTPNPLEVVAGTTATLTATVVPDAASGDVAFRSANPAVAAVLNGTIAASPGEVLVRGEAEGSTTAVAEIPFGGGWVQVGSATLNVTAVSEPPAGFEVSPLHFCERSTATMSVSVPSLPGGASAFVESSDRRILGFGSRGRATATVAAGANSLDVSAQRPGTVRIDLVVNDGGNVTRIAGPNVTVSPATITLTLDDGDLYLAGDRVTFTVSTTCVDANERVEVEIPGEGTRSGQASGFSFSMPFHTGGYYRAVARLANRPSIRDVERFTVVGLRNVTPPSRTIRLDRTGNADLTLRVNTVPSGFGQFATWSVSPARTSPTTGQGARFNVSFDRQGTYTITARIGADTGRARITVRPSQRGR